MWTILGTKPAFLRITNLVLTQLFLECPFLEKCYEKTIHQNIFRQCLYCQESIIFCFFSIFNLFCCFTHVLYELCIKAVIDTNIKGW